MKLGDRLTAAPALGSRDLLMFLRDWQGVVRGHFLYSAVACGLLDALHSPATAEELAQKMGVRRPVLLEALLDVGLSLGELALEDRRYRLKGRRARALVGPQGETYAALLSANITYYNDVYRQLPARLGGAPLGDNLGEIGELVARVSTVAEPFVRAFLSELVIDRGPMRILDVGCGSGVYLRTALDANPQVTGVGVDVDPAVVQEARGNLESWDTVDRFEVMMADICSPPTELQGPFDLMMLIAIIHYIPLKVRPELFRTLRGLLAPGGTLAIVSTVRGTHQDVAAANLNLVTSSIVGCTVLPDPDRLKAQLREGGFAQVESRRLMPRSALLGLVARSA
jgi:SAM-dependent methyltransferase